MALINTLNDIGNAIREKTGGTELIPLKDMANAISGISSGDYDDGYADGVASVPNPLEYARILTKLYTVTEFPANYELKIDVPFAGDVSYMLENARGITKLTLSGNNNGNTLSFANFIRGCASIVEVDLTNFIVKPSTIQLMCGVAKSLKAIKGVIDLTECTNTTNAFLACSALKEIQFKENSISLSINFSHCANLSTTSVQSIIDGLTTVETAQTLTLNSTIVLTDEQKATIESKGWTLVQ